MAVAKRTKKEQKKRETVGATSFIGDAAYKDDIAVSKPEKMVRPKLYIEKRIVEIIDSVRKPPSRKIKVSQNQWIVEAIIEKLEREGINF